MVVETTTVSVTKKVSCNAAGQFETVDGQAVMVEVLVDNTVEVVYSTSGMATAVVGRTISRTGHTVVDRTSVSVVTKVLCDLAGQSLTSGAQAVTVEMRVEKIVEVLNRTVGVIIAESKVGVKILEEGETEEEGEEEGTGDTLKVADSVLRDTDTAPEETGTALDTVGTMPEVVDKTMELAEAELGDVNMVVDDAETPESPNADEVVLERDTSGCVKERTLKLAEGDGMKADKDGKGVLVVAGTATLTGTEEVVFAYGATTELAAKVLVMIELKLVLSVMIGTDVLSCRDEVAIESGRTTELLVKIELVGMKPLLVIGTDVLESGIEVVVESERVTELLVKTEMVGMELLLITGIDVLACAEVVAELLVIGANTVVVVEFKRGVAVVIGVTVLLVTVGMIGIELLLGRALLEKFKADDDEVTIGLDFVSGATVGVQENSEAINVTVLPYTEVTSTDEIRLEYRVSVVVTVATQGSVV
jgi:hypothetical protein